MKIGNEFSELSENGPQKGLTPLQLLKVRSCL